MTLTFYPHSEDAQKGSIEDRVEVLMDGAIRYKAAILDLTEKRAQSEDAQKSSDRHMVPRDQPVAYNWDEIAIVLREVRGLATSKQNERVRKEKLLSKLAEIYEVLRDAKMTKLESVRLVLVGEASQLREGSSAPPAA